MIEFDPSPLDLVNVLEESFCGIARCHCYNSLVDHLEVSWEALRNKAFVRSNPCLRVGYFSWSLVQESL